MRRVEPRWSTVTNCVPVSVALLDRCPVFGGELAGGVVGVDRGASARACGDGFYAAGFADVGVGGRSLRNWPRQLATGPRRRC